MSLILLCLRQAFTAAFRDNWEWGQPNSGRAELDARRVLGVEQAPPDDQQVAVGEQVDGDESQHGWNNERAAAARQGESIG